MKISGNSTVDKCIIADGNTDFEIRNYSGKSGSALSFQLGSGYFVVSNTSLTASTLSNARESAVYLSCTGAKDCARSKNFKVEFHRRAKNPKLDGWPAGYAQMSISFINTELNSAMMSDCHLSVVSGVLLTFDYSQLNLLTSEGASGPLFVI